MNRFKSSVEVAATLSSDGIDYELAVGSTISEIVVSGPYEDTKYENVKVVGFELAERPPFNPAAPVYDGVPCMGVVADGIANMRDAAKMMLVKAIAGEITENDETRMVVIPVDRISAINGSIVGEDGAVMTIVADAEGLEVALEVGGTVNITEDVVVEKQNVIAANAVINAEGHTVSNEADIWNDAADTKTWSMLSVQGEGTEGVIEGGEFVAKENDCYCVDVRDGAKLTVKDGTFKGNVSAIYVHTGELVVEGGEFMLQQLSNLADKPYVYTLNCLDANFKNGTAKISVKGGKFHGFNPAAEPEGADTTYIAEGYESVEESEGVFVIVPKEEVAE